MILDAHNRFSNSQAETSTAVGDNVISLEQDRAIGVGEPMCVLFNIEVAALVSDNDEDYTFDVEYSSDAAQTTARRLMGRRIFESGTPDAPAQDADLLAAGFQFVIPIPPTELSESELFLGIRLTQAGTSSGVTWSAVLIPMSMVQKSLLYADGIDLV